MSRTPRPGYTLLEVLLAAAIGVLLLAALYAALDAQLGSTQAGRDVVERTTLARALLNRMAADITPSLGNIDPARYRTKSGSNSSTTSTTSGSTGSNTSTSGTGTTGSTTSTSATSQQPQTQQPVADPVGAVRFNLYVQGDSTSLTIYVSRLPRELYAMRDDNDNPNGQLPLSDLRRISYWLAGAGDAPLGLARQELKVATSDDATGPLLPEGGDEGAHVIAEEVKELKFSYFDGSAWQESWDGTVPGSDGATPIGPPRAIAIEITLVSPGKGTGPDGRPQTHRYRHVVAVPVADGTAVQASTGP